MNRNSIQMKIPEQYLPVMPYLILKDAPAFLRFAKEVFDASEQIVVPGEGDREIMHAEIRIGDAVIMFGQAGDQWSEKPAGMFIYVSSVDAIHEKARQSGCKILVEPNHQDYGYTSGFEDPFGNQWWIVEAAA